MCNNAALILGRFVRIAQPCQANSGKSVDKQRPSGGQEVQKDCGEVIDAIRLIERQQEAWGWASEKAWDRLRIAVDSCDPQRLQNGVRERLEKVLR